MREMRSSIVFLGAIIGRMGQATVSAPGGCEIGLRPIDLHLYAMKRLGVSVEENHGKLVCKLSGKLQGSKITFAFPSVGATENAILAAVTAKGTTTIFNAAREPEIMDLCNFLNSCGARIKGAGESIIVIEGVEKLHGCNYELIPDMIEAGTFMIAAAATGGDLYIDNVIPKHMEAISVKLREMGVTIDEFDDGMRVYCEGPICNVDIKTSPYPGFPTDMNPQVAVLMCLANGKGTLTDTIWDNRFRYVEELKRMNAEIEVEGNMATFSGGTVFKPARVRAVDLRAGAAMIIGGLVAKGQTEVDDFFYVERGYDNIIEKLRAVGARIMKIS